MKFATRVPPSGISTPSLSTRSRVAVAKNAPPAAVAARFFGVAGASLRLAFESVEGKSEFEAVLAKLPAVLLVEVGLRRLVLSLIHI